jgi:hypothetical protein
MTIVPDAATCLSLQDLLYPHWFMCKREGIIMVAMRCTDVGQEAFACMVNAGRARVVPLGAECIAQYMHKLCMQDSTRAIIVMAFLWNVCDPDIPSLHQNDPYEQCFFYLVHDFLMKNYLAHMNLD